MYIVVKRNIVYKSLCKVCLITFAYRENVHMSHLFIMFSQVQGKNSLCISTFIPVCGRYNWEISQLALILVKILANLWATIKILISAPSVNQIYF